MDQIDDVPIFPTDKKGRIFVAIIIILLLCAFFLFTMDVIEYAEHIDTSYSRGITIP